MIGTLLSIALFVIIVLVVSYVVLNAIEDEREFERYLNAENEDTEVNPCRHS